MKVIHRIPTTQYAYVEFEEECLGPEDALSNHKRYLKLYEETNGLSTRDWAKVRNKLLETGECDPNLFPEMSAIQRWWINETKLAFRAMMKDNDLNERVLEDIT